MTDPATKVAVPITVKASVVLLVAGSALSWVTYLATPRPFATVVVGGVIGTAIAALLIFSVYRGRNWVRILLTVLASLGTAFLIVDLITGVIGYTWLDLIGIVLSDVSVILLWVAPSRRYFGAIKQARLLAASNEPSEPTSRE